MRRRKIIPLVMFLGSVAATATLGTVWRLNIETWATEQGFDKLWERPMSGPALTLLLAILAVSLFGGALWFWTHPEERDHASLAPSAVDDWSLVQAVEHLEQWISKQAPPHPDHLRRWAFAQLREAVILERIRAWGEHFEMVSNSDDYPSLIPSSFMKGAEFEFQNSEGIDRFDGGLAYRDRDQTGYGGVRFLRHEIEERWSL